MRIAHRIFVAAGLTIALAWPAHATFEDGWQAYQKGEFGRAFTEWQPLAERGDARAQFNLGVLLEQGKGVE